MYLKCLFTIKRTQGKTSNYEYFEIIQINKTNKKKIKTYINKQVAICLVNDYSFSDDAL